MGKRKPNSDGRARRLLAQEAARIVVEQGIRDYRVAKVKAAERLGLGTRGALPRNAEIEEAVGEHLQLFGRDSHSDLLRDFRETAVAVMDLLQDFSPRLVGPVLNGTADSHSSVNLHVFADSAEIVAARLATLGIRYRNFDRRLRSRRNRMDNFAGYEFHHGDAAIEATVFPVDGIRQSPISPIDGRPMQRADIKAVRRLIEAS